MIDILPRKLTVFLGSIVCYETGVCLVVKPPLNGSNYNMDSVGIDEPRNTDLRPVNPFVDGDHFPKISTSTYFDSTTSLSI